MINLKNNRGRCQCFAHFLACFLRPCAASGEDPPESNMEAKDHVAANEQRANDSGTNPGTPSANLDVAHESSVQTISQDVNGTGKGDDKAYKGTLSIVKNIAKQIKNLIFLLVMICAVVTAINIGSEDGKGFLGFTLAWGTLLIILILNTIRNSMQFKKHRLRELKFLAVFFARPLFASFLGSFVRVPAFAASRAP